MDVSTLWAMEKQVGTGCKRQCTRVAGLTLRGWLFERMIAGWAAVANLGRRLDEVLSLTDEAAKVGVCVSLDRTLLAHT